MLEAHLTAHEWSVIEHPRHQNLSQAEIARQLKCHPGTINWEMHRKRPSPCCTCQIHRAQEMSCQRRAKANRSRAKLRHTVRKRWVRAKVRQRWSHMS